MSAQVSVYRTNEILAALIGTVVVQLLLFILFAVAGRSEAEVQPEETDAEKPMPIAVTPVIDDLPLLKLGGERVKAKLPDMWKKQAPIKQYEAKSAPSPEAEKTPDAIPTTEVAKGDAEAPPPDAEIVKRADEMFEDPDAEVPNIEGEGSPGGVKEGTETDPLKARAVSQYKMKVLGWFNRRFKPPLDQLSCEELKNLSAGVSANIGADRRVTGYTIHSPSGNAVFDAKVRSTMDRIVGQQLPPPPKNYPQVDVAGSTERPRFSGNHPECK